MTDPKITLTFEGLTVFEATSLLASMKALEAIRPLPGKPKKMKRVRKP